MHETIDNLNRLATVWTGLMAAVLWQSTVVIAIVTVVALMLRRASPRVRYWLWQIVAIKMLVMPFWVLAVPWPSAHWPFATPTNPSPSESEHDLPQLAPPPIDAPQRPQAPSLPSPSGRGAGDKGSASPSWSSQVSWQTWLFLAWAAVVVWRVASIARQRYGLHRLLRVTTAAGDNLTARVRELSQKLGLRRAPRVLLVDHSGLLFVCGLWNPKLVMPRTLPGTLSAADTDQVVLHELAHLLRGDLYWGWTIEFARTIYFFHPLVYWVGYCLNLERELSCDQVAMSVSGHAAGDYAQTLVRVVGHASAPVSSHAAALSGPPKNQTKGTLP
jgi:beta-lactamase regulating signal transducer with metallopeptidase domain